MCTFTWWPCPGGYGLFFNRDELNTRAPEASPAAGRSNGLARIVTVDGERGGAWLGVNERGVAVVLLNDYTVSWRPESPACSRGELVKVALGSGTLDGVGRLVSGFEIGRTGAFHLVALDRTGAAHVHHWDGQSLDHFTGADVERFFSSSSFRPAEVIAARRARYDQLPDKSDEDALRALHWAHDPAAGAHSVLMRRPDAATRSVCEVRVGPGEATLAYTPVVWRGDELAPSRTESFALKLS